MTKLAFTKVRPTATGLVAILVGLLSLITIASAKAEAPSSLEAWRATWGQVLQSSVDASGRVDFRGLAQDRATLDLVVAFIGKTDPVSAPSLFPTPASRLAYYLDSYNALAMYGIVEAGVPRRLGWLARAHFFDRQEFRIGGRNLSLSTLENSVIRTMGDPRVHFALNCMSVSCPRLPQTPFSGGDLEGTLDAATRTFMNEDRNVHVDEAAREVRLSAIFRFYTSDFLVNDPTLVAYVNRYRTVPVPPEFRVKFAEYDWRVNDQAVAVGKSP